MRRRAGTAASSTAAAIAAVSIMGGAIALGACGCGTGSPRTASGGSTASGSGAGGASASTSTGAGAGTAGAVSSGTGGGTTGPQGPVDFCKDCVLQSGCSTFANGEILEASGIAASALHADAYYVHNDSGDTPRFFASSCAGDDLGVYAVQGASAVDWEDMARGPCAAGGSSCLYFADIGDNNEVRSEYAVYRTVEPAALTAGTHMVPGDKLAFVYPDGSHDAETLLVHPTTGQVLVVTKLKAAGKSGVYAFPTPLTPGSVATLVKVGEVAPPIGSVRITSGAIHPKGQGILLRTYTNLFFYALADGQPVGEALGAPPCDVPVMLELQGEAVTFTASGASYVTVSEKSGQSLHFAACK